MENVDRPDKVDCCRGNERESPSTNRKWSINGAFGVKMVGCKSYASHPWFYDRILPFL
jgi:hypothetical protein